MHTLFCLILPALVSAQWGTPPPIVTDEQCKDELLKIRGCVTNFDLLANHLDSQLTNKTHDSALITEIDHIIGCSGLLNCNVSRLAQSYLENEKWILAQFYGRLEPCMIENGLYTRIKDKCQITVPIPEKCYVTTSLQCATDEMKKHPKKCSRDQRKLFSKIITARRASCLMEKQMVVEMKKHGIERLQLGQMRSAFKL